MSYQIFYSGPASTPTRISIVKIVPVSEPENIASFTIPGETGEKTRANYAKLKTLLSEVVTALNEMEEA